MKESFIRTHVANGVGEVQLDRPEALNALEGSMIRDMHAALLQWRDDPAVTAVLVTSLSDRAFCAGGDIKPARDAVLAGDFDTVRASFAAEYRLDELVATGLARPARSTAPRSVRRFPTIATDIDRIVDGKTVDCWVHMDLLGLMQQLGGAGPAG